MKNEKIDGGGWRAKKGDPQVAAELEEIETGEKNKERGSAKIPTALRGCQSMRKGPESSCGAFVHKPSTGVFKKNLLYI